MKNMIVNLIVLQLILMIGCMKNDNPTGSKSNQGEWNQVRISQNDSYYYAISFGDQNNGWAISDSDKILHTSDGGNSWLVQASGTIAKLRCVYFANAQKGWIGGYNNSIGTTTDGGITWIWQHPAGDSSRIFTAMSFIDINTGWFVSNKGEILHTENGAITWTPQISGTSMPLFSVQFLDNNEGWAIAGNRNVLHTTDGGNNWTIKALDTLNYGRASNIIFRDMFFYDHSKGWIATDAATSQTAPSLASVVRTSDSGTTWTCYSTPELTISSIRFVNDNLGWAASPGGILQTTNSGETWSYQLRVESGLFEDICFIDPSHGWAITFTGNIYRYQAL